MIIKINRPSALSPGVANQFGQSILPPLNFSCHRSDLFQSGSGPGRRFLNSWPSKRPLTMESPVKPLLHFARISPRLGHRQDSSGSLNPLRPSQRDLSMEDLQEVSSGDVDWTQMVRIDWDFELGWLLSRRVYRLVNIFS